MQVENREMTLRLLVILRGHVNGDVAVVSQKATVKPRVKADARWQRGSARYMNAGGNIWNLCCQLAAVSSTFSHRVLRCSSYLMLALPFLLQYQECERTMNREYHKWWSPRLGRDMELLVFGHSGVPAVVFPTSQGRFYEFEDRGMVGAIAHKIENGELQLYCLDSIDAESWYNRNVGPRWRIARHMQYESYVMDEVLPLVRLKNHDSHLISLGCSFGGYHAVNFALKHPDIVAQCVSMSGAYDIHQFLDGYYDDDCYFNCPPDYLANMSDDWFLTRYRQMKIVLASGEWDMCLDQNVKLSNLLNAKAVGNWLDIWGDHTMHDWPYWLRMAEKYF